MGAYFVRRLLIAIPVLLGLTALSFFIISLTPGDPLTSRLDPEVLARVMADPALIAEWRAKLGLDQPLPIQYLNWLTGVLQGDWGYAISTRRPIVDEIGPRIPPSLILMVLAAIVAVSFGVPAGILAAVKQYGPADYILSAATVLLISTPSFVLGLVAIYVFGVTLGWLPVGELYTFGKEDDLLDRISHFVLPAMVLGLVNAALLMRYTRASMLESMNSDYITTARSKGLPSRVVVIRHGLRNALIPIITVLAFLMPELIAGAVVTEVVFNWPGLGQLSVRAANAGDPALMMGIILIVGIAVIVASIIADLAYSVADPRVRYVSEKWPPMSVAEGTGAQQVVTVEHEGLVRLAARRFLRHRLAMIGLIMLIIVVLTAIFLPLLVPLDPLATDYTNIRQPPSEGHLLGGDLSGRDVWARVVHGTRVSLVAGLGAMFVFITIGTVVGVIAGAFGGWADQALMRFTDIILAIPPLLLIIVFISIVGPSLGSVIAVIGLVFWPATARLVRGQLLSLREAEFITAARVLGVKQRHIIVRHLIPNIFGPLTVVATFGVASAILIEAALSFLGLGVRPPTPSLGDMITPARSPTVLQDLLWVWVPAGIVIAIIVMSVNWVGDGLRDALDPRATRRG